MVATEVPMALKLKSKYNNLRGNFAQVERKSIDDHAVFHCKELDLYLWFDARTAGGKKADQWRISKGHAGWQGNNLSYLVAARSANVASPLDADWSEHGCVFKEDSAKRTRFAPDGTVDGHADGKLPPSELALKSRYSNLRGQFVRVPDKIIDEHAVYHCAEMDLYLSFDASAVEHDGQWRICRGYPGWQRKPDGGLTLCCVVAAQPDACESPANADWTSSECSLLEEDTMGTVAVKRSRTGGKFDDTVFPPSLASLGESLAAEHGSYYQWKSASNLPRPSTGPSTDLPLTFH